MNLEQKREIIIAAAGTKRDGVRHWNTYKAWLDNNCPTVWKLSKILHANKTTVGVHLELANAALHAVTVKDAETWTEEESETPHKRECRALAMVVLEDRTDDLKVRDYPLYKFLLSNPETLDFASHSVL